MPKPLTTPLFGVMLTSEVVIIFKKAVLLVLALGFAFCSHLRPRLDFCVGEETLLTGCSPAAAEKARAAALAAAEEILPGPAVLPEYSTRLKLGFCPAAESAPELCDALLRSTEGLMLGEAVYVRGRRLGTVEDAVGFNRSLRQYIDNTMPTWASFGSVRGLELKSCYTREAYSVPHEDMIMLITGMSPVMYTDGEGRISPV